MKGFARPNWCIAVLGCAVAALVLSCAASVSRGGENGTITVALGGPRGLATGWPDTSLPTFSSVTVTVSATDMDTVTSTASGFSGSISVKAPAGNDRLVEVIAVPAPNGGAPLFAKSYYGSATVDLEEGQQTTAQIALSLGESKLVLFDFDGENGYLSIADSISGSVTQPDALFLGGYLTFALDQYGRGFIGTNALDRYTSLNDFETLQTGAEVHAVTYDASRNILYSIEEGQTMDFIYRDLATDTELNLDAPLDFSFTDNRGFVLAAADGHLYAPIIVNETFGVGKIAVTPGAQSAQATLADFITLAALGMDGTPGYNFGDMLVKDGVLYILANNLIISPYVDHLVSKGKIIAVDAATMTGPLWTAGDTTEVFPSIANKNTRFYGPIRFVGVAPKKLYIADEGFYWQETEVFPSNVSNIDRVVEVDLEKRAITGTGFEGEVGFFSDLSGYQVLALTP